MNIIDFDVDSKTRVKKLVALLESRFGLTIDFRDPKKLIDTLIFCEQFKINYKKNTALSESDHNADYVKAAILSEAIRIVLKEIAPKRKIKVRRIK